MKVFPWSVLGHRYEHGSLLRSTCVQERKEYTHAMGPSSLLHISQSVPTPPNSGDDIIYIFQSPKDQLLVFEMIRLAFCHSGITDPLAFGTSVVSARVEAKFSLPIRYRDRPAPPN